MALGLMVALTACDRPAEPPAQPGPSPSPTAPAVTPSPTPAPTPTPEPTPEPEPTPTPDPTPPPLPSIGRKSIDLARYYNGITVESEYLPEQGEVTAAVDRNDNASYVLEIRFRIRVPIPASTREQLMANDPKLPAMLTGFDQLLEQAKVSPAFTRLYENKVEWNRNRVGRLDDLLSRHNFYDCDTILEVTHPETGRRALLVMADMDVNTDGSDGDRNVEIDDSSMFFQPQTSYRWRRQTKRPNPFLAKSEARLKELEREFAEPGLSVEKNRQLRQSIDAVNRRIFDLKTYSFLISDTDPFIVLPGFMLRGDTSPFAPKLGDYALVIYGDKIYPAILGDAGPSFKMGEASMRLCREIDPRTSSIRRAVSNIRVTYIVFPGTAPANAGPPDLEAWHDACETLLNEIGGSPTELHRWENLVPPWPTPTPSPTPTPEPSSSPEPSPDLEQSEEEAAPATPEATGAGQSET